MSRTISTSGTVGIRLTKPSDNPATVTAGGTVSTGGGYAIYGSAGVTWLLTNLGELSGSQYGVTIAGSATITNDGTMAATGSKSTGVLLGGGGRVVNGGAGFPAARISGSYIGVQIAGGGGTVANFGMISAGDMPGSGAVALMQGGTVINGSTAITGASIGGGAAAAVYIIGGTSALVANQGTITGLGTAAAAVELLSGGRVTNGAPGNAAATIAAPQSGVYVTGGAGTVVNDGVIAGGPLPNNGYYLVPSWGVAMRAGGAVTNGSAARIDGDYRGVDIQGGAGIVVNSGTITAEHANGRGINLTAGGAITNATTAAVIAAGIYAIAVAGARGTVVNHGTITGTDPDYGLQRGVALMAGGIVTNGGPTNTAAIISVSFSPVGISGGAGTVVNYGTLTDTGDAGSGLNMGSGGTVTNGPAALINGRFYGVAIAGGAGTVVNSGTIIGNGGTAVAFAPNSSNRLVLHAGGFLSGLAVGGTGSNVLELAADASAGTLSGLGSRYVNFDQASIDSGATWTLVGPNSLGAGATISNSGSLKLLGANLTDDGLLTGPGVISIDPSTLIVNDIAGGGTIEIGSGGTLTVNGAVAAGETITFTGTNGVVNILHGGSFAGTITGQGPTDQVNIACFAAGTHILTAAGEVPVEALRPGDRAATLKDRRLGRIVWSGHRHVDCRHRSADVWPVRVRAGALGDCLPTRDLLLSPDHAVFVDGMLAPVRHLINGSTVVQEPVDEVTYCHVELAGHDVILAEGLPCESYLDTGNRAAFGEDRRDAFVAGAGR